MAGTLEQSRLDLIPNPITLENPSHVIQPHSLSSQFPLVKGFPVSFEGIDYSPPQAMTPKESRTTESKPAVVPLSSVFCADDADVIIRAAGDVDFRVHKSILSLVSPIFKDMFTLPQPPTTAPDLSHVDVTEPAGTWDIILRTIYPMPTPPIGSLDDLESLLLAAKKYEMQFVIDSHQNSFRDRGFIQRDPLHLYAIACVCGFEDWAKYVARNAENLAVTRRANISNLPGLTIASYHRLISFLAEKDNEWSQILREKPIMSNCYCGCDVGGLGEQIKEDLKCPPLPTEQIYLRALEWRSRGKRGCGVGTRCYASDSEIKSTIEQIVREMESVCDKLMCDKQYVR